MSGEPHGDDDPDLGEDFILEDATPAGDLEDLFQDGAKAKPKGPAAGQPQDESDLLFEHQEAAAAGEQFEAGQQFAENSPVRWGGQHLAADDIGIPVGGGEAALTAADEDFGLDSEQELQLVDDERDLDDAAGTEGEVFVLDDGEGAGRILADAPLPTDTYPVEEGWEPVAETASVLAPGAEAVLVPAPDAEPELAGVGAEGGGDDGALYVDTRVGRVVGAPRRHSRWWSVLPSLAAAALVVGAGAVVVLRPEWFGLHFQPQLVERVQVARPTVDVHVPPPAMPSAKEPSAGAGKAPDLPQPAFPKDPVQPMVPPVQREPVAVPPEVGRSEPAAGIAGSFLPVGDTLWVGEFGESRPKNDSWSSVRPGSKAFAQLRNGNFFVGSIKAVASEDLVLRVGPGEITLARTEIEKVTALDSDEYAELQQATSGFLRLSNNNRLVGTILKSVVDDNYVLQMRSDRIVVPKSAVERIVEQGGDDRLRFGSGKDEEDWLRGMAERELRAMSNGEPPAPGPESKPVSGAVTGSPLFRPAASKPVPAKPAAPKPAPAKPAPAKPAPAKPAPAKPAPAKPPPVKPK